MEIGRFVVATNPEQVRRVLTSPAAGWTSRRTGPAEERLALLGEDPAAVELYRGKRHRRAAPSSVFEGIQAIGPKDARTSGGLRRGGKTPIRDAPPPPVGARGARTDPAEPMDAYAAHAENGEARFGHFTDAARDVITTVINLHVPVTEGWGYDLDAMQRRAGTAASRLATTQPATRAPATSPDAGLPPPRSKPAEDP